MKKRNRELSPFGMASLDLFASALGAFILISIVIFPMIGEAVPEIPTEPVEILEAPPPEPVDCPICPVLAAVPEDADCPICPVCPECPVLAPMPVPTPVAAPPCPEVTVPEPIPCPICPEVPEPVPCPVAAPAAVANVERHFQFPHLDLVIALDVTSSMGRQVAALKAEVGQLAILLEQISPSFGIGMVAFGDRHWDQPLTVFPLRQISGPTRNRAAFRGFVNGLSVRMGLGRGGNADQPEAFLQALSQASRMTWRPESVRRVIVLVTDSPAYPEDLGRAIAAASTVARSDGHRVSTVYVNPMGLDDPTTEEFLQRVANAGGGQFVRDVGGSLTVNLLLSLL